MNEEVKKGAETPEEPVAEPVEQAAKTEQAEKTEKPEKSSKKGKKE